MSLGIHNGFQNILTLLSHCQICFSRQELERKIEQSRKNQQEMEEEIRMWHDQLRNYHCVVCAEQTPM